MFKRFVCCVVVPLTLFILIPVFAQDTIRVPGDYPTIQQAIDAASFGDTVLVSGKQEPYYENIVLKEGVTVEGEGRDSTTIQGDYYDDTVVMADDSGVRGFTIDGNPSCVRSFASNVTVDNNTLVGHYFCIHCQGGSIKIADNNVRGAPPFIGVYCDQTSGIMENCQILAAYLGVKLQDADFKVYRCVIEGTDNGINIDSSTGLLMNCYILNNNFDGVHLRGSDGFTVANNVVYAIGSTISSGLNCFDMTPIIANNIITSCKFGIKVGPDATPLILFNDLYANSGANYATFDEEDYLPSPGVGELSVEPGFVAPNQRDFHLLVDSECKDAGYTSSDYKDPDGSATDMGAHGGPKAGWVGYRIPPTVKVTANRDFLGAADEEPFIVSITYSYQDEDVLEVDSYTAVEASFGLYYLPWFSTEPMAQRKLIEPSLTEQTEEILTIEDPAWVPLGYYTFYAGFARPGTFDFYSAISAYEVRRVNKPVAKFTVTPDKGRVGATFSFDASGSWDVEDDPRLLKVKWDWENDGTWDEGPTLKKTTSHVYTTSGTKTIRMEVVDTEGYTGSTTRQVIVTE